MSIPDSSSEKLRHARDIFAGWLRERDLGGAKDFEDLCASHPRLTAELQSMRSAFELGQAAASSRTLHDTLRERFGEVEEVTVRLDEAASSEVSASDGPKDEPATP